MNESLVDTHNHSLIIFDGVCNVCSKTVQFIIRHDRQRHFRFASLQSDIASSLLTVHFPNMELDSIVLIEGDKAFSKSTAVLRICRKLDGFWKAAYVLILIPKPLRNVLYRWFAKRRYQFFGKQDTCMTITPEIRNRFLEIDERKGERPSE
ncbi:thiol-disulfide oxidoreductase DCC family protein [Halobacillus hunanensis]|uniref:thiol-disulfide oxidoreductase DCC family protein n=1 Tax=Halobacillus hunanensis TaxID=578214 RepID=UPI0009A8347B|nr:DCC1-like thiol-disulfide oxidoreductase family protein [Halobacillus hunanensis]